MVNFHSLDHFTAAYIECALWSSVDDKEVPLDDNYDWANISEETLNQMIADCKAFQDENFSFIQSDLAGAGHDFWLTRNGHGAGFWDGDWKNGDILTAASKIYGSVDLYIGDDGQIYS